MTEVEILNREKY